MSVIPSETTNSTDGGPAFAHGNHEQGGHSGMTLRDWFAGQALKGMLSSGDPDCETYANAASYAYSYADGMLAERRK